MKSALGDLAIFGGPAAFSHPLHVGAPNIGDRKGFLDRVNDLLDRRWLTNEGRYVRELEQRIADMLGVRHCLAICNGTTALEIATRALGLSGEVIVPSMTFVATAHALRLNGIRPVFCDIDPQTHTLDPGRVEAAITPHTTGILGVHLWARSCAVEALEDIATRRGVTLFFDAAHAFGCSHRGRMIGCFGSAEIFSFHATKFFNTLEGGAIATNDDALAERVRLMRNFGFLDYDQVVCLGTNGKMNEISAAMGLNLLDSLDELVDANRRNYRLYEEELSGCPGVQLLGYDERERCNFQYIVVEIDDATTGITRDDLGRVLWAEQILARRYFYPGCHRMEPYATEASQAGQDLPVTERVVERVLALPTGTAIGPAEIRRVCAIIQLAVRHGPETSRRLLASPRG